MGGHKGRPYTAILDKGSRQCHINEWASMGGHKGRPYPDIHPNDS